MPKITKTMQNFKTNWESVRKGMFNFCYRWSEGDCHGDGEDGAEDPHDEDGHLGPVLARVALQREHDRAVSEIEMPACEDLKLLFFGKQTFSFRQFSVPFLME